MTRAAARAPRRDPRTPSHTRARGRDAEPRPQPLGKLPAGRQRGGAVARVREPLDQAPIGRFGERIERHLGAREPDRLGRVPGGARGVLERFGEPVRVLLTGLVRPVVLEAVQDRSAASLECAGDIALVERLLERARVDPEVRALERDGLPGRNHVAGRRAQGLAELGQGHPQAGAGRLVEHVGPEPRRQLGTRLWARVQRKIGEHRSRPPRGRQREFAAIGM